MGLDHFTNSNRLTGLQVLPVFHLGGEEELGTYLLGEENLGWVSSLLHWSPVQEYVAVLRNMGKT